ncbi:hypothetical protein ACFLTK_05090, partial [Chloroflexota bacterium]
STFLNTLALSTRLPKISTALETLISFLLLTGICLKNVPQRLVTQISDIYDFLPRFQPDIVGIPYDISAPQMFTMLLNG